MFGLEAIFRNGVPVGHLRRSDYGFFIDKTIGYGYIRNPDGGAVSNNHVHTRAHKPTSPTFSTFSCSTYMKYEYLGVISAFSIHSE